MNFRRGSTASPINTVKISIGFDRVVDPDFEQRALVRIHRRLPKLLRIHFAQTFVTLDRQILLGCGQNFLQQRLARRNFFAASVLTRR